MLVFLDESGDPWFKFDKNSSEFFTIGLVIFEDKEEAQSCDQRIDLIKKELQLENKIKSRTYILNYQRYTMTS